MPQADQAYRLARWLTHNRSDAEDVVQDASLRAFRSIGDFNGSSPRAWFLTIVRHAAFSWLAKNRPKDVVFAEDLAGAERAEVAAPAFGAEPPPTPEKILLDHQQGNRVTAAVQDLALPFREALVLREFEGLSYRDIAEILGVPIGTVMSRLARARAILAETLAEEAR